MMHFLTLPLQLSSDAFEPIDPSKFWSWLRSCRRCCRQSAAIQRSFEGMGRPAFLSAARIPADANDRGLIIRHRRERVGVEDHSQSSGSIFSNSLLTIRLIGIVSLWRCLRPPASLTQGFSSLFKLASSSSVTASVTKARSGMPRWAATDLARRKMGSGISRVVFTFHGPIFMGGSQSTLHKR
jgi:hypothetical protein